MFKYMNIKVFLFLFIYLFLPMPYIMQGTLVPWLAIEPTLSAVGARSLNHWTGREVQRYFLILQKFWKLQQQK